MFRSFLQTNEENNQIAITTTSNSLLSKHPQLCNSTHIRLCTAFVSGVVKSAYRLEKQQENNDTQVNKKRKIKP